MRTLNLGILAHVDAGKTTLTERLLYAAGVIDEIGSVDAGTTQTDSLALEQQRGITIRSAVVSFAIDDVTVNLIDTPGHPDFIAEVERVLSVLDGAVLVISAVEGVQPQTPLLMRALQRLRVPTLLLVNKIDRPGADPERVLQSISDRLTPAIIPMGSVGEVGTRAVSFAPYGAPDDELVAETNRALLHPVFFGSALTGAGVDSLTSGIAELLPAAAGDVDGPVSGSVFKIERGPAGEKIAFVRLFSGTVRTRDRWRFGQGSERKGDGDQRLPRGLGRWARVGIRRRDREALGSGRDPDRRRGRHAAGERRAPFRAADTGDRRRARRRRRQGPAPCRARAARGAGPAHRRPTGRRTPGDLRLALRRGAEGGRPSDAGKRLRPRRHVQRRDPDLRRASRRHRRVRRGPPRGLESVSRHDRAARPTWAGRLRNRFPIDGRCSHSPAVPLQDGRELHGEHGRLRPAGAAGGPLRLAGHGLPRDADQVQLQRSRRLALEARTAEHRRRLPKAHAARHRPGARAGGDGGL